MKSGHRERLFTLKCVIKVNGEVLAIVEEFGRALVMCAALADIYEDDDSSHITLEFK